MGVVGIARGGITVHGDLTSPLSWKGKVMVP